MNKTHLSKSLFILLILFSITFSCEPEGHSKGWQPLDLLEHGPAVTIMAPTDAEVKVGSITVEFNK